MASLMINKSFTDAFSISNTGNHRKLVQLKNGSLLSKKFDLTK